MDAHTLKGMAIVSIQEGTKLGYVEQPLLDLISRKVAALQVRGESGTFIVRFDEVQSVGADAITVASSAATHTPSTGGGADELRDLDELGTLKAVDHAGTFLGTVSHVEIDPACGEITRFEAHKGGMLGMGGTTTPIDARAIVSVGSELLTVNTEASVLAAAPWAPPGFPTPVRRWEQIGASRSIPFSGGVVSRLRSAARPAAEERAIVDIAERIRDEEVTGQRKSDAHWKS